MEHSDDWYYLIFDMVSLSAEAQKRPISFLWNWSCFFKAASRRAPWPRLASSSAAASKKNKKKNNTISKLCYTQSFFHRWGESPLFEAALNQGCCSKPRPLLYYYSKLQPRFCSPVLCVSEQSYDRQPSCTHWRSAGTHTLFKWIGSAKPTFGMNCYFHF